MGFELDQAEPAAVTTVTIAELLVGVRVLPDGRYKDELPKHIELALQPSRHTHAVLAFDEDAARSYADVLAARKKAGAPISTADAQIAAICLAHEATCATRNVNDFAHTGVHLINPWQTDLE